MLDRFNIIHPLTFTPCEYFWRFVEVGVINVWRFLTLRFMYSSQDDQDTFSETVMYYRNQTESNYYRSTLSICVSWLKTLFVVSARLEINNLFSIWKITLYSLAVLVTKFPLNHFFITRWEFVLLKSFIEFSINVSCWIHCLIAHDCSIYAKRHCRWWHSNDIGIQEYSKLLEMNAYCLLSTRHVSLFLQRIPTLSCWHSCLTNWSLNDSPTASPLPHLS